MMKLLVLGRILLDVLDSMFMFFPCFWNIASGLYADVVSLTAGVFFRLLQGIDVFGQIREAGRALIDHVTQTMMLVEPAHVVIAGTSRGGISALHVMSEDHRIQAAALVCPVTDLSRLSEFSPLSGNPLFERAHAMSLLDKVADRPIWITINHTDERVDEQACLSLAQALSQKNHQQPNPVIWPESGHAVPMQAYEQGGEFLRDWIETL